MEFNNYFSRWSKPITISETMSVNRHWTMSNCTAQNYDRIAACDDAPTANTHTHTHTHTHVQQANASYFVAEHVRG